MDQKWFSARWSQVMNGQSVLEPSNDPRLPAKVCMSYASSFGRAQMQQFINSGMGTNVVSVGSLRGIRLTIMKDCGLRDDEVYLDCDNLLKERGTKLVDGKVLNDRWDHFYQKAQRECRVMFVMLTEGYRESQWCERELNFAVSNRIPMIVVTYDHSPRLHQDLSQLGAMLARHQIPHKLFYWTMDDCDERMDEIAAAVRTFL
eukprot:TRINITY_DN6007_c0_g1_i1.p1 TRINITY_DN6007_c0_g1~~TRINITY_DN6007_c0_g1_i1.p1  ORF type:complete len:203 (-),score=24.79 TRINITY_DN6007_c0_g1_i1:206-814(-)